MSTDVVDLRSPTERRVRAAWSEGPPAWMRIAGGLYRCVEDTRHCLYDIGVLASWHPGVPVISVGGLSAGGTGKTPLAAEFGRWLRETGRRTAILTHGYADEMDVHRRLLDAGSGGGIVLGSRDREAAAARAAHLGAEAIVVDSGFQRRSLARDFDVLAVSEAELAGARRRLPAGPLREGWASAGRADAVVVVRRPGWSRVGEEIRRWLATRFAGTLVARVSLLPVGPRPANRAAEDSAPEIAVAVSSVMDPCAFGRALAERGVRPEARFVLPDHGEIDEELGARILAEAGGRGIVGTLKDLPKLRGPVGEEAPLWVLEDRPEWREGGRELRRAVLRAAEVGP